MKTYYETLGVPRTASQKEIRKAYRRLAMKYHPDRHHGDTQYESMLKELNVAYETLSDLRSKAAYDFTLSNHGQDEHIGQDFHSDVRRYSQQSSPHQQPAESVPISAFERIKSAFFFLVVIAIILWVLSSLTNTESPNDPNRPKSGELNFKNSK